MMFTEVFVPKGTHTREELTDLAQRLTVEGLHGTENTDPGVLEFLEGISHVVVHEIDVWVAGGRPLRSDEPPRYVVRVHLPGPWRKEMSGPLIERITRALAEFDPDPERLRRQPHAEVHVLGVPEGGYGVFGRQVGESAMAELINQAVRGGTEAAPGTAVDPVCGCVVSLDAPGAVTAEVEGRTYTFCCAGCRRHFLTKRVPAAH